MTSVRRACRRPENQRIDRIVDGRFRARFVRLPRIAAQQNAEAAKAATAICNRHDAVQVLFGESGPDNSTPRATNGI
ncbi:MAG TPA: hypothetical protein VN181_06405 [Thermoanaerobaculia bacterium]|nr:hypothetical protein [Thermoanaerobaculia bacterium]